MSIYRFAPALAACVVFSAGALAQDDGEAPAEPDPGFSILAPEAEAQAREALAEAAVTSPAGAFLSREAYLAARGERSEDVLITRWQVERSSLGGEALGSETREIAIGDFYVHEAASDGTTIYDFATGRILSRTDTLDGEAMRNLPIVAHVHRQMDTFAYFTRGGELDEVQGPDGSLFERFWIEAAMGVRLAEARLTASEAEDGHIEVRRDELGSAVFTYRPGEADEAGAGSADEAALFQAWMRHAVPVHPDALAQLSGAAALPESFSFLIFSPSSPDGRRERWTRIGAERETAGFPWPQDVEAAGAHSYEVADPEIGRLLQAGFAAAAAPAEEAPSEADFVAAAEAARRRADLPGAYLALFQSSHHYGPCRPRSERPSCQRLAEIMAAGLGDPALEALVGALSDMEDDRPAAIEHFRTHLHRDGMAGAAANLIAAQALAMQRSAEPDSFADLDPLALFAAGAEADPHAPMAYWHAGRYAAGLGDVASAWLLFDIARSLPAAEELPPARETAAMSGQLRELAPQFFGPPTD